MNFSLLAELRAAIDRPEPSLLLTPAASHRFTQSDWERFAKLRLVHESPSSSAKAQLEDTWTYRAQGQMALLEYDSKRDCFALSPATYAATELCLRLIQVIESPIFARYDGGREFASLSGVSTPLDVRERINSLEPKPGRLHDGALVSHSEVQRDTLTLYLRRLDCRDYDTANLALTFLSASPVPRRVLCTAALQGPTHFETYLNGHWRVASLLPTRDRFLCFGACEETARLALDLIHTCGGTKHELCDDQGRFRTVIDADTSLGCLAALLAERADTPAVV